MIFLISFSPGFMHCSHTFHHSSPNHIKIVEGAMKIGNADIYYKIVGHGTPTFILHGGPGDTHDTMLQLGKLADQYKIIFYDQRAAGRSSGDADIESHTVEQFVEDLEQLRLKLAGGKINLIGGSWGTMIAMMYASKYSQNINAMVLMSTMGVSSDYFKEYRKNIDSRRNEKENRSLEEIANSEEFKKGNPEAVEKFWRLYFRSYFYNPELVKNLTLWIRDEDHLKVPGRYAKLGEFLSKYDLHDALKTVSCPTLILHGDYDPTPLNWVKPIHKNIADSELIVIKNAGHWLWVEAPDEVLQAIRTFLKSHELQ